MGRDKPSVTTFKSSVNYDRIQAMNSPFAAHHLTPAVSPVKHHLFFIFFIVCLSVFALPSFAQKSNEEIKQGNEAYRKNDFATAIKEYSKVLQADDKNAVAKFNLANAQQKSNNTGAAAQNYDDLIASSTDASLQSKAYYNKGLAMLEQKKLDAAIDAFKQSLRLAPADNDTRENLQKALDEKKAPPPKQPQQPDDKKQPDEKKPKMDKKMMEQNLRCCRIRKSNCRALFRNKKQIRGNRKKTGNTW